jgi:hypothetical protein
MSDDLAEQKTKRIIKILKINFIVFAVLITLYLSTVVLFIFSISSIDFSSNMSFWLFGLLYLIPIAFLVAGLFMYKRNISIWVLSMILIVATFVYGVLMAIENSFSFSLLFMLLNPAIIEIIFGATMLYLLMRKDVREYFFNNPEAVKKVINMEQENKKALIYQQIIKWATVIFLLITFYVVYILINYFSKEQAIPYSVRNWIYIISVIICSITLFILNTIIKKQDTQTWFTLVTLTTILLLASIYNFWPLLSLIFIDFGTFFRLFHIKLDFVTLILSLIVLIFLLVKPTRRRYDFVE